MDLSKYRALYHQEALRHLGRAEESLTTGADLNAMFRAVHTVKGQAAQMRDEPVYLLAHTVEDLFDRVRKDELAFDEATQALVAEAIDRLSEMVRAEMRGETAEPAPDLEAAIRLHLRRGATGFDIVEVAPTPPEPTAEEGGADDAGAIEAVAELMAVVQRLRTHAQADPQFGSDAARLDAATRRIYGVLSRLRQVGFETIVPQTRRHMHTVAAEAGREVSLEVRGVDALADPTVLGVLQGALSHLVSNAVLHGIEPPDVRRRRHKPRKGQIRLSVERVGESLIVELADDGQGVDVDRMGERPGGRSGASSPRDVTDLITQSGVSSLPGVSLFGGRGVGMSAVREAVEQLGGRLSVASTPGRGCTVRMVVPVRQRFEELLLVEDGGTTVAFPARLAQPAGERAVALPGGVVRPVGRVQGSVEGLVSPPPFPFNLLPRVNGTTVGVGGNILFVVDPSPPPPSSLTPPGAPS